MTVKVNGFADIGEFLTGNIDFFTITTLVPCEVTSVSKPLSELKKDLRVGSANISTVGGVTIFGTTYATDDDYTDAYNAQSNLDLLVRIVSGRAQPVMLNAINEGAVGNVSNVIPTGGHAADFGTNYAGNAGTVYSIKFASEHESSWTQDTLATAMDEYVILDLTTGVIDSTDQFSTSDATYLNTIVLRNQFI